MQITWILIIINFIVFIIQQTGILDKMAFMPAIFINNPHTILTSMFMHANMNHLLLNMFGLFMFGSVVEHEFGKQKMLIVYFFSGFAGSLTYVIFGASPFTYALGASGAIFGLIGAATVLKPKMLIWTMFGPLPMIAAAVVWGLAEFVGFFGVDTIAQSAHLGGLAGGVIMAFVLLANLDIKWSTALVFLPVLIAVVFSFSLPSEIMAYTEVPEGFTLESTDTSINYKMMHYTKEENHIFTFTYPSKSKFNTAESSRILESFAGYAYSMQFGVCSEPPDYEIELNEETVLIEGHLCSEQFRALRRICSKNTDVVLVEFYQETPAFGDVVSCTGLSS